MRNKYYIIFVVLASLCAITMIVGNYANQFVIAQNGYMPTKGHIDFTETIDGIQYTFNGHTQIAHRLSGNHPDTVYKLIDSTTKYAFLGDIFYSEDKAYYFSVGDWILDHNWIFFVVGLLAVLFILPKAIQVKSLRDKNN